MYNIPLNTPVDEVVVFIRENGTLLKQYFAGFNGAGKPMFWIDSHTSESGNVAVTAKDMDGIGLVLFDDYINNKNIVNEFQQD